MSVDAITEEERKTALLRANNIDPMMGDNINDVADWIKPTVNAYEAALTAPDK